MCRPAELTEKLTSGKHCSDWKSTITASIGSTKLAHESGWKQHFTSYHLCLVPIKVILWFVCFFKSFIFFILFLCVYLNLFLSLACVFAVHSLAYMRNNCADLEKLKTFTNFGNKNEEHFKVKIIKIIKLKIMINKSGFESSSFAGLVVVHVFFFLFFSNSVSILFMHERHEHKCDVVSNLHLKQNKTPGHPIVA